MDAAELLRKLRRYARTNGLPLVLDTSQGRGSHIMVYLGGRRTILPMHSSKELGKGLLHAILKDLDVRRDDL